MADTLRLRWNESAKPVLADRDGEVDTNWANGGTHVVTADATHVRAGSKSFKLAASGVGDFTTNNASLASGNNATFSIATGNQYVVTIWTYSEDGCSVKIKTGGVESSAYITSSAWTASHFKFTAITATTAFQLIVTTVTGGSVWFELEPFCECVELNALAVKGMDDPDAFELFPVIQNRYLDGSIDEQFKAFRRKAYVDCGVLSLRTDRLGVLYWMVDNDRTVDYLTEVNVPYALSRPDGYENEWIENVSVGRRYVFELLEPVVRTTFPV